MQIREHGVGHPTLERREIIALVKQVGVYANALAGIAHGSVRDRVVEDELLARFNHDASRVKSIPSLQFDAQTIFRVSEESGTIGVSSAQHIEGRFGGFQRGIRDAKGGRQGGYMIRGFDPITATDFYIPVQDLQGIH